MRQNSVETLPNISYVQAKASVTVELSLYRKLGIKTMLKLGRGATIDDDPEAHQETRDNLHNDVSSDSIHAWVEMSMAW